MDHTTIFRWVKRYAPELDKRLKWYNRGGFHGSWRVDETYIKVKGGGMEVPVQGRGQERPYHRFYLSHTRNAKAVKRFLGKCLRRLEPYERPKVINTDMAAAYNGAMQELERRAYCPRVPSTENRST